MNPPKVSEYDYVDFLIGTQQVYSCTKAARVQPDDEKPAAHDAITRLIRRLFPPPSACGKKPKRILIYLSNGILIVDDSTLDK